MILEELCFPFGRQHAGIQEAQDSSHVLLVMHFCSKETESTDNSFFSRGVVHCVCEPRAAEHLLCTTVPVQGLVFSHTFFTLGVKGVRKVKNVLKQLKGYGY